MNIKYTSRVRKAGNSFVISIPKKIIDEGILAEKDYLQVEVSKIEVNK